MIGLEEDLRNALDAAKRGYLTASLACLDIEKSLGEPITTSSVLSKPVGGVDLMLLQISDS